MKKLNLILLLIIGLYSCGTSNEVEELDLDEYIDTWHRNAALADFDAYFNLMSDDFHFLGTAPKENWNKSDFADFSKPYFDKGKGWDFAATNRKWYGNKANGTVWFDEDLDTWMQGCRGSGVMKKVNGEWKIAYYNLTVLIENNKIQEFIVLRKR